MSRVENPYGDGFASRRIAARLVADGCASLPHPVPTPAAE
jgi:hypothetical protein